jgi:hypothetical protein
MPRGSAIQVVAGSSENHVAPFQRARILLPPTQTFVGDVPPTTDSSPLNLVDCCQSVPFQCLTKPPASTTQTSDAEDPQRSVALYPLAVAVLRQVVPSYWKTAPSIVAANAVFGVAAHTAVKSLAKSAIGAGVHPLPL